MRSFTVHSNAIADPRLAGLDCGSRWVWFGLLCLGAEARRRGVVEALRPDLAERLTGGDPARLDAALRRLQAVGLATVEQAGDDLAITVRDPNRITEGAALTAAAERMRRSRSGPSPQPCGDGATERATERATQKTVALDFRDTAMTYGSPLRATTSATERATPAKPRPPLDSPLGSPPHTPPLESPLNPPRASKPRAGEPVQAEASQAHEAEEPQTGRKPERPDPAGRIILPGPFSEPSRAESLELFGLIWEAFGDVSLSLGWWSNQRRYDPRAWRYAVETVLARGQTAGNFKFLALIAADWRPGMGLPAAGNPDARPPGDPTPPVYRISPERRAYWEGQAARQRAQREAEAAARAADPHDPGRFRNPDAESYRNYRDLCRQLGDRLALDNQQPLARTS